jgi:hypothetical protein
MARDFSQGGIPSKGLEGIGTLLCCDSRLN